MKSYVLISNIINKFNKTIYVQSDKSISIRWALMASQAVGKSRAYNLLKSEDVESTLNALKKFGVIVNHYKDYCEITGNPIPLERLEARPIANMTVQAQEEYERSEKTRKDERE